MGQSPPHGRGVPSTRTTAFRGDVHDSPGYRYLVTYLNLFPQAVAHELRCLSPALHTWLCTMRARPDRLLILARLLMQGANKEASLIPDVKRSLEAIAGRWSVDEDDLLRRSFIPRQVLGLLKIKRAAAVEKQLEAREVRRLRQLQARQPEIYGEVPILKGRELRNHGHRWWTLNFGLDKESEEVSRQRIWGEVEVGLCELLRPPVIDAAVRWRSSARDNDGAPPEETSWRAASRAASRLLRARYPALWPDRPDRVRSRYSYKPKRSQKTS